MGPFMCQKFVSMTFFIDTCTQKFPLQNQCVSTPWSVFSTQACRGKPIKLICNILLTKTYFSMHITHSSVNFTWFVLLTHQIFDDRILFKPGASFLTKTCFSEHITHSSVNFTWFVLLTHQIFDDRILFKPGASFLTKTYFSMHITHYSENFTWFVLLSYLKI